MEQGELTEPTTFAFARAWIRGADAWKAQALANVGRRQKLIDPVWGGAKNFGSAPPPPDCAASGDRLAGAMIGNLAAPEGGFYARPPSAEDLHPPREPVEANGAGARLLLQLAKAQPSYPLRDEAALYICSPTVCSPPLTKPEAVAAAAERFRLSAPR